ncbi:dynamin family protein [Coniochaeta ligniaria NRRL 30616]|uniref:Dynamin family protein n=1 Tax=Coniochaeta ligniaria NRRL 30616 TaxID=1408157 RepID=A0A1J7ISG4_9PEZI|nr:dynamin family protein [Coniochaeta ligniaria NRRL 30616]
MAGSLTGCSLGVHGLGDDQAKLLDLMDKIQFAKISTDKLPQIVVVGDQSSGKSSVLTSLTGIPFIRSNLACTRFATEIRLRRSGRSSTTVWIMSDESRPKQERKALEAFRKEVSSDTPEILTGLMREASELISPSHGRNNDAQRIRFAAKDKLIIEKSGPDQPLLTLVDLPGLVKVPSSEQTAEDLQMIDALSDMYMKDPMTIILAVVSGNIDFVQGIILDKVARFDTKGHRTIGVLTKPDLTDVQGYTDKYLGLVTRQDDNTNYHFKLGWYVLRNPGHSSDPTMEERQREEADFFSKGKWATIPPSMRGADALRAQLSIQLQRAIVRRLPSLQRQIQEADAECTAKLDELGVGLNDPKQCTVELGRLFALSDSLVLPAVDGTYRNPPRQHFFRDEHDPKGTPAQNLRARVLQESESFANHFRQLGRRLTFVGENGVIDVQAKKEFARKVAEPLLPQIRGRELPGDPNTRAPYILFRNHSKEWPVLAQKYQDNVTAICRAFLAELLGYAWPTRMRLPLREYFLKAKLSNMSVLAKAELENLNSDKYEIQPFDPDYEECMKKVILDTAEKNEVLTDAERVVEQMIAYYKLVERIFIRNVIYQVVERHLLMGIRQMFESVGVHNMADETIVAITADDAATREARNNLKMRKEKIQEAREICAEIETRRDLQLVSSGAL